MRILVLASPMIQSLESSLSIGATVRIVRAIRDVAKLLNVTVVDWEKSLLCFPGITVSTNASGKFDAYVIVNSLTTRAIYSGLYSDKGWSCQEGL